MAPAVRGSGTAPSTGPDLRCRHQARWPAPRACPLLPIDVQVSQNEIREALESSDEDAKVDAMQKAIAAILAGEQFPALFITIVRYVLPSENHLVQKLLLLYLVSPQGIHAGLGGVGCSWVLVWEAGRHQVPLQENPGFESCGWRAVRAARIPGLAGLPGSWLTTAAALLWCARRRRLRRRMRRASCCRR